MKKLIICALIACLCVCCACFAACEKDDGVIRLTEVTHSVFYAPLYVAMEGGYFEEEGITIELSNGGGADSCMTALLAGQADIGLHGPEACIYVAAQGRDDHPIVFAQLTKKDGSFLVGRTQMTDFEWSDLAESEVMGGRVGGAPATTLEYLFEQNGLYDGRNITINYGIDFDLITAAFEAGTGDYCTMFEPNATNFQNEGKGYVIASVGEGAGDMPYTAFTATRSFIAENPELIDGFLRALIRAMNFVEENDGMTIAQVLAPQFAGTEVSVLANAIEKYKQIDAYSLSPIMEQEDFEHLQDVIISAGVMDSRVDFETVVDNSIAQAVLDKMK